MTLLLLACVPSFSTKNATWTVTAADASWLYPGDDGLERVLVGTELTLVPELRGAEGEADWSTCTRWEAEGASVVGEAVLFDTVGVATLTLEPEDCPLGGDGESPAADEAAVEVIPIDGLASGFYDLEVYVEEGVAEGSHEADYPADWRPAEGEARRLASGNLGWLLPKLEVDADHGVTYSVPDAIVRYSGDDGSTIDEPVTLATSIPRVMPTGAVGERVSAELVLPAGSLPMGEIEFVDATGIVEADIVVDYPLREDGSRRAPFGARLVSRDSVGVVYGADVAWAIEGDAALAGNFGLAPELTLLAGDCPAEGGAATRSATLSAVVNGLSREEQLTWTVTEEDCPVQPVPDDNALGATGEGGGSCGCDGGAAFPGAGLVLVAALSRRRYTRS